MINFAIKPFPFLVLISLIMSACGSSAESTAVPSQALLIVAREKPTPTHTSVPTNTPVPPTETPIPTKAPTSTYTPLPTSTTTPSPTPMADEIVFQSNRNGDFEIYIMSLDGNNQRPLTFNNVDDKYPRVSPDGRYITFESERDSNREIYIMNRDGGDQRRLTFHKAADLLPAFSPDGAQIIFASERSGFADHYIINLDGTNLQLINQTPMREGHVSWSINDELVFNASIELYWQIYTTTLDGSNHQQLTNSRIDEWSPEWSPDGSQILFLSERGSSINPAIYLMEANGSNVRLIYDGLNYEWGIAWSPDGSQIIFTEDRPDGISDILIMNRDGTNVRHLTERGSYPFWAIAPTP